MRVCVNLCCAMFCLITGSHCASAQVHAPADTSQLIIKHDIRSPVALIRGDTLAVHVELLNAGVRPVKISWGYNLFVLEALLTRPALSKSPIRFPRVGTWGRVEHWEFPNPGAAYLSDITETNLDAGKVKTVDYHIPFDSSGTYSIRVCVDLVDSGRICRPRDISVTVK